MWFPKNKGTCFVQLWRIHGVFKCVCVSVFEHVCVCLCMFECLHVHVVVCMHVRLLTSPVFVIEDDAPGHRRLVVLLVDVVEEEKL